MALRKDDTRKSRSVNNNYMVGGFEEIQNQQRLQHNQGRDRFAVRCVRYLVPVGACIPWVVCVSQSRVWLVSSAVLPLGCCCLVLGPCWSRCWSRKG